MKTVYEIIRSKVIKAFSRSLDTEILADIDSKYPTIEEYELSEHKRFRMKKEQKARGLTREEAFRELHMD